MLHRTCATLFSGGGLADIGLKQAGLTPLWAVEYDPAIAAVYARNHGDHVIVASVADVDYSTLPAPWLLWASPPCPSFSVAKTDRGETENDLDLADAVARAIRTLRPEAFVLENVRGYVHSESYRRIRAALDDLDYWSDAQVVNAADYGVPQTRERLILRARAGGWMQPDRPWPRPQRWRGWYEAIADLVPTLPESKFAEWQLKRLPAELRESVLMRGDNSQQEITPERQTRGTHEPAPTIRTDAAPRAYIVDGQPSNGGASSPTRPGGDPMMTVHAQMGARHGTRALLVQGTSTLDIRADEQPSAAVLATVHSKAARPRALLVSNAKTEYSDGTRDGDAPALSVTGETVGRARALAAGRVVAMTPRCLARFQGVPDDYWLPERRALACKVIGNGVAVAVARVAAETLMDAEEVLRAA